MKHIINTSFVFNDIEKLYNYLPPLIKYCLPAIESQTNKNFVWNLWHNVEHTEIIKNHIKYDFVNLGRSLNQFREIAKTRHPHYWQEPEKYSIGLYEDYVIQNGIEIQTKLDCDDWISPNYVGCVQTIYEKNKDKFKTFIINSQPEMYVEETGKLYKMNRWSETNISMIYSLCAKNYDGLLIEKDIHDQMFKYVGKVFMTPEKMAKYIVHGNNFYANTEERLKGLTWNGKL